MKQIRNTGQLLRYIEGHFSHPDALNYQSGDGWEVTSTEEFISQVKHIALGLRSLGVNKGDMIGILSDPSPRWTIADLAIMSAGAVSVPLFGNISYDNFEYEINLTNIKYIFVSGKSQWEMHSHFSVQFKEAISLYDSERGASTILFQELIERGKTFDQSNLGLWDQMLDKLSPDDMATIIFTSGTTGVPKGAMFYQKNICGQANEDRFNLNDDSDIYLSILPLAHIFARVVNLVMLAWGVPIYYIKDITTLGEVCKTLKPTIAIVVPRILEKIFNKMNDKVEKSRFLKRTIGQWAFSLAGIENESFYKKVMHPIADAMVYSKLREALGGRFRFIASGGARLNPRLHQFYLSIGLPLYEGWGLTETGLVTSDPVEGIRLNSVGIPFNGFTVKLGKGNELLVKGVSVMQGYYKNEVATKEIFTDDGWLRTGDKGLIDSDGFVTIESRLNEIYKTSTGESIVPVPIEHELAKSPIVDIAMVIGEARQFASCLLFPDFEVVKRLKKERNMESLSDEEFLHSPYVCKEMDELIANLNRHLNNWEQLQSYRFVLAAPSIEGGELTPTLKLRREVILEKYHNEVESMYMERAA